MKAKFNMVNGKWYELEFDYLRILNSGKVCFYIRSWSHVLAIYYIEMNNLIVYSKKESISNCKDINVNGVVIT